MIRQFQLQARVLKSVVKASVAISKLPSRVSSVQRIDAARFQSSAKSWVPTQDHILQKITTTAMVHEVSLQQMEMAANVVPWFLSNMPVTSIYTFLQYNLR